MTTDSSTHSSPAQRLRWHAFPDGAALQAAVLDALRRAAAEAIHTRGRFSLVLAGGTTPKAIYQACRGLVTDWSCWHCYFGDERCLPADHPDRNSVMAQSVWLDHVAIPPTQIHAIPAERGADAAATAYAETLRSAGDFDFVLLGLGEDGHTASLFPDQPWGNTPDAPDTLAVFNAPKPPAERVSISAQRLGRCHQLAFVVTGEGKREAVRRWRAEPDRSLLPAGAITPRCGVDVFCEETLLAPPR